MSSWTEAHGSRSIGVLVVESDPADAERISVLLTAPTDVAVRATIVRSCAAAVALADGGNFDVVLCDLCLPDSPGKQTVDAILAAWPNTPVVALVDDGAQDLGSMAVRHGCQDFLVKGLVDSELLQRTLRHAIERGAVACALKESEERFRTLVEVSPDAILVCTVDRVIFANPAAARIFGAAHRDDLVGIDPLRLLGLANGLRLMAVLDGERDPAAAKVAERVECRLTRLDGSGFDAEMTSAPVRQKGHPAAELIIRDITNRKLGERRDRLAAAVFQNTDEAMMVTDRDNRIVAVNGAFERVTGYSAEEALGRDPRLLSSGRHDKAFYRALWTSLTSTGHWHGEVWNRRKNGELYVQRLTLSLIRDREGRVVNHVGIFDDVTDEREEVERIRYRANYDALTGLPNRSLLYDRVLQAIAKAVRSGGRLALLFLDLDGFKPVNDRFGHLVGDQVLVAVAERLQACVRDSDTVGRLGGDEFVILLAEMSSAADAPVVSNKVLSAVAAPFEVSGVVITDLGASIGIALYPGDGETVDLLLAAADKAMYAAKRAGKGHYVMAGGDGNRRNEAQLRDWPVEGPGALAEEPSPRMRAPGA